MQPVTEDLSCMIGTTIFSTIEGRICGLHVKSSVSFFVTLLQEPVVMHLGSFRFASLAPPHRGTGSTIFSAYPYARGLIEAFEANVIHSSVHVPLSPRTAKVREGVGVALLLPNESGELDKLIAPQHLVGAFQSDEEVEDGDEMRESSAVASPPDQFDKSLVGVKVKYIAFGAAHDVLLQLKPCPPLPQIRDPLIWTVLSDLLKSCVTKTVKIRQQEATIARQAQSIATLRRNVPQRQSADVGSSSSRDNVSPGGSAETFVLEQNTYRQAPVAVVRPMMPDDQNQLSNPKLPTTFLPSPRKPARWQYSSRSAALSITHRNSGSDDVSALRRPVSATSNVEVKQQFQLDVLLRAERRRMAEPHKAHEACMEHPIPSLMPSARTENVSGHHVSTIATESSSRGSSGGKRLVFNVPKCMLSL